MLFVLLVTGPSAATVLSAGANPIRKIVTLMQNMQKEIEAEGAKEKELFDKFMCYCSGGTAKLKSEEAEKSQIGQDLITHKSDREGAKGDIEEATVLRTKEEAAYSAEKADSETNIAAMAKAIPALEKGMGGAALLQMPNGNQLKKVIENYPRMDASDRQ